VKKLKLAQTEIAPKLSTTAPAHKYAAKLLLARKHGSIQCTTCDAYRGVKNTYLQESNIIIPSPDTIGIGEEDFARVAIARW